MLLGVSPAAIVPILLGLSEFGGGAVLVLTCLVAMTSGMKALRSRRKMRRIEMLLSDLSGPLPESDADVVPDGRASSRPYPAPRRGGRRQAR